MNTFYEVTGIIGDVKTSYAEDGLQKFFDQVKLIHTSLDKQAYVLDSYLSYLFHTMTNQLPHDAVLNGFDTTGELIGICSDIIHDEQEHTEHWFYETAKEYIQNHPLPYQESYTRLSIYCVLLNEDFSRAASERFLNDAIDKSIAVLDICDLRDLYEKMEDILGNNKQLEKLNVLFCKRFLQVNVMTSFQSGMTDQMLYSLSYRDRETSRQVFQLLADMDWKLN